MDQCGVGLDNCEGDCVNFQSDPEHCGDCDTVCTTEDTDKVGVCTGTCGEEACPADTWNLDGQPGNGCEYTCVFAGAEECNGLDDDCDGEIDETFELETDVSNCGQCGVLCGHPTVDEYVCALGLCIVKTCLDGFKDADGDGANGCEVEWTPAGELWVDAFEGAPWPDHVGSEGEPFDSIQDAVDQAGEGYLIHVLEGVYDGSIEVDKAGVVIRGAGAESTFIMVEPTDFCIHVYVSGVSVVGLSCSGGLRGIHIEGTPDAHLAQGEIRSVNVLDVQGLDGQGDQAQAVLLEYADGYLVCLSTMVSVVAGSLDEGTEDGATAGIVAMQSSGGAILANSISEVFGADSAENERAGGTAAGVGLIESTDFLVQGNSIAQVQGGTGGDNGFESPGGGVGGVAAGVLLWHTSGNQVSANSIASIVGGDGGLGVGSYGGAENGGMAAGVYLSSATHELVHSNVVSVVTGGDGGCTSNGYGTTGSGGVAAGVALLDSTDLSVASNAMSQLMGGKAGQTGGQRGTDQVAFGVYLDEWSTDTDLGVSNSVDGAPIFYRYGVT